MKQPHEIKADYKKADEIIVLGERKINGKYNYVVSDRNLKEIREPIVIRSEIEAIADEISEINGVLKDNYSKAKTEKSKQKIKISRIS